MAAHIIITPAPMDRLRKFLLSGVYHISVIVLTIVDIMVTFTAIMVDDVHGDNPTHHEERIHEGLALTSLTIISIFVLEILLTVVAFGPSHFHTGAGWQIRLFDAIIVCVGFALELSLHGEAKDIAGIILVFRLWRLCMLVTASIEMYGEGLHEQIEKLTLENEELRAEIRRLTGADASNEATDPGLNVIRTSGKSYNAV